MNMQVTKILNNVHSYTHVGEIRRYYFCSAIKMLSPTKMIILGQRWTTKAVAFMEVSINGANAVVKDVLKHSDRLYPEFVRKDDANQIR